MTGSVVTSLLRINRQRMLALRRELSPYGYVGFMHLILIYTARHPGTSQEEAAAFYALDKASAARDARRLEDAGHIRRQFDPDNRRRYQLFVTEAGARMAEIIDETHRQFERRLSARIAPEDWEKLRELLAVAEESSHGGDRSGRASPRGAGLN